MQIIDESNVDRIRVQCHKDEQSDTEEILKGDGYDVIEIALLPEDTSQVIITAEKVTGWNPSERRFP